MYRLVERVYIVIGIVLIGIFCQGIYLYGESNVMEAIDLVSGSKEDGYPRVANFTIVPTVITYSHIYIFENPSEIEIKLHMYADIYYEEECVSTIQFTKIVPAHGRLRVEPKAVFYEDGVKILEELSPVQFRYVGKFSAMGKYLSFTYWMTWDEIWYQTIDFYRIYPN